jgi:putative DNA primase/helicase
MNPRENPIAPLQKVLELLVDVRRSGAGFVALCPSHDDNRASLSVGQGDDGRVLLHCFAVATSQTYSPQ